MRKFLLVGALAALLPLAVAGPASAAPPRIYHTITASSGNAVVDQVDGCVRTEAFVSSTVAMYAAQPGPVNKQGFTDVLVRLTDICATAAAAGGGVVIAEFAGRAETPLQVDPRLRSASVTAQMVDEVDPTVPIAVSVTWTGVGPLEHTTPHFHELFPGLGVVSGAENNLRRQADAVVSLRVGAAVAISSAASDASLEQVKAHCIEVPRPGVEGFFPCFGFPA